MIIIGLKFLIHVTVYLRFVERIFVSMVHRFDLKFRSVGPRLNRNDTEVTDGDSETSIMRDKEITKGKQQF